MLVQLQPAEQLPIESHRRGFIQDLERALPELKNRHFIPVATEVVHLLPQIALTLQQIVGMTARHYRVEVAERLGEYIVIYQFQDNITGSRAGILAAKLLTSLLRTHDQRTDQSGYWNWQAERDSFFQQSLANTLGFSSAALIHTACQRGIEWHRIPGTSVIQLRYGNQQHRMRSAFTTRTNILSVELAGDKRAANRLLRAIALPVPRQKIARSADQAVLAAMTLKTPVVTKPNNSSFGRGVSVELNTHDEVIKGFSAAARYARTVLVEEFIQGEDYRLLVVDYRMVAATRRTAPCVRGDGKHTIEELVAMVNCDHRRGFRHEKPLSKLILDDEADASLARYSFTRGSIPPNEQIVYIKRVANLSAGGMSFDVTSIVHPDNMAMAEAAASAIGLDVAGVDFISPDISQSYKQVGGAICEVNAAPGLRMHIQPGEGGPQDVAGAIIDMLFPATAANYKRSNA